METEEEFYGAVFKSLNRRATKVKNLTNVLVSRSKSAAWKEGYDASCKGYNVYQGHHGTERHKQWLAGWIERQSEKDNEI